MEKAYYRLRNSGDSVPETHRRFAWCRQCPYPTGMPVPRRGAGDRTWPSPHIRRTVGPQGITVLPGRRCEKISVAVLFHVDCTIVLC